MSLNTSSGTVEALQEDGEYRSPVNLALGRAFRRQPRDLTAEGLTQPGYERDEDDAGPGKIVVLIPAHDEEALIGEALRSLAAQSRVSDEVIVITDRCTDLTREIALAHKVQVEATVANLDKKAGALNQVLEHVLPRLTDNDAVLIMDADGSLSPAFLAVAAHRLREPGGDDARVGGVGGIFLGYPVAGILGHLQDNEYIRYAKEIGRRKGRADVLTGTATLFAVRALRDVVRARNDDRLPPGGTGVFSVHALTEDNELTLALKHLGYRCVSPQECTVGTEVMPTAARLFHQRLRWQRGGLENLLEYGLTRHTAPYIGRQIMTYIGVAFVPFFFTTLLYTFIVAGSVPWSWFWFGVTGFVVAERAWAVKRGGWRSVALAITVVPEIVLDIFLHCVYVRAFTDTATGARETWDHTKATAFDRRRPWWQRWHQIAGAVYIGLLLAAVVALALVLCALGLAWATIAILVLSGAAFAAVRWSGLDLMGLIRPTGELAGIGPLPAPAPQGFGGLDVPSD
ncbi:glycosyltransferase family 2 protein [Rhodococcus sp. G-MC3]|uniref:glycosyltransferase n=1 Tax=Rhodococcus sp. G-MC3 TaxID=3046209 RepID=UPI0024B9A0C6|nr:glycosyltransferase family 2 protein [Rhodococcus sp. G-MC3]MDJ0392415.1 glycosyltransferase family 2 protein [Rhodococcus sp. G-MC3]